MIKTTNDANNILHLDMNGAFAENECFHRPEIRHLPVVVAGRPELRKGIVLAKNSHAKKYNIKTAETLNEARAKCPDLVVCPPNYPLYKKYCHQLFDDICSDYSDLVEIFSIDEGFINISAAKKYFKMTGPQFADLIRERVKREMGITISAGVSYNKIFAKLASDQAGTNETLVYSRDNYKDTVWQLPVTELFGVGRATARKFEMRSVRTIGDLAQKPLERLKSWLGKWGEYLWIYANGKDMSPVRPAGYESTIKSIGNGRTMPRDLITTDDVEIGFMVLCESVAARLRAHGLLASTIEIYIRDNQLFGFARQRKMPYPTCLASELFDATMQLFHDHYNMHRQPPLRSIGIRGSNVISNLTTVQLDVFSNAQQRQKEEDLARTIDALRAKFGRDVIIRAKQMKDRDLGIYDPGVFPDMPAYSVMG